MQDQINRKKTKYHPRQIGKERSAALNLHHGQLVQKHKRPNSHCWWWDSSDANSHISRWHVLDRESQSRHLHWQRYLKCVHWRVVLPYQKVKHQESDNKLRYKKHEEPSEFEIQLDCNRKIWERGKDSSEGWVPVTWSSYNKWEEVFKEGRNPW